MCPVYSNMNSVSRIIKPCRAIIKLLSMSSSDSNFCSFPNNNGYIVENKIPHPCPLVQNQVHSCFSMDKLCMIFRPQSFLFLTYKGLKANSTECLIFILGWTTIVYAGSDFIALCPLSNLQHCCMPTWYHLQSINLPVLSSQAIFHSDLQFMELFWN